MIYRGQCWWVTGASSGIGAALVRELAARGARVALSGRDMERLEQIASELTNDTTIEAFDVRDEEAMLQARDNVLAWSGGLDGFVANAGVSQRSRATNTDMQVYRDIIDIDLTAQISASQALLPQMTDRGSGRLVFISSVAGKVGVPLRTAYSAAKFGLAGYGDALRAELSQEGVKVHMVYPGSVATNVSRNALTGSGEKRGRSDKAIDEGIFPGDAVNLMLDAIADEQREIIIAEGVEQAMGEARRTPEALLDQIEAMVAAGYMEKMEEQ